MAEEQELATHSIIARLAMSVKAVAAVRVRDSSVFDGASDKTTQQETTLFHLQRREVTRILCLAIAGQLLEKGGRSPIEHDDLALGLRI